MPKLSDQMVIPGLEQFTITQAQYMDRLISLVQRCASIPPEIYRRELDRLQKMRPAMEVSQCQDSQSVRIAVPLQNGRTIPFLPGAGA